MDPTVSTTSSSSASLPVDSKTTPKVATTTQGSSAVNSSVFSVSANTPPPSPSSSSTYSSAVSTPTAASTLAFSYLEADELARNLSSIGREYVVVDVRDEDHYGGNIPGSLHFPSQTFDTSVDNLVTAYGNIKKEGCISKNIVFHCMYSQVRGPSCAKKFLKRMSQADTSPVDSRPQVMVLRGGFAGWDSGGFPSH